MLIKVRFAAAAMIILAVSLSFFAQKGGKAEPKRIQIPTGRSNVTLTGTLSNSQEMEYVFTAKKGQTVSVKLSNTNLFDYRIFKPDIDFETQLERSTLSTFELAETGDYFLFVRKKMARNPRSAKFSLVFSVK